MKRVAVLVFLCAASTAHAEILKIEIEGIIDPFQAEYVKTAINQAEDSNAEFLLIRIATPGGLQSAMRDIVTDILNSPIPVVCYVNPTGERAASAGFFILLAADVAAMSPGTNTGAATPIFAFGQEEGNEVLLEKIRNDALASLRSIVEKRKRNYEMAAKAVQEAASFTETEALEGGLIDLVAKDESELLKSLEGREIVRFSGERHVLKTEGQSVDLVEMTWRQKILSTVSDPSVAALLGLAGMLGLFLEFKAPGTYAPGVIGGLCLLLAMLGMAQLPINLVGILLILAAIGLFIAEAKVQGFGVLGVCGSIAMVFGLLILVDSPVPALRIPWAFALSVSISFAAISIFLMRLIFRAHRGRIVTGGEALVGMQGIARSDISSSAGRVSVNGELWNAVSPRPIAAGAPVRIVSTESLRVTVEGMREEERRIPEASAES